MAPNFGHITHDQIYPLGSTAHSLESEKENDVKMTDTKRYYWLRLKKDFFKEKEIKKLRRIAGGDTYTIIYLKMQLLSLTDEGKLYFEGVEDAFYKELALELDEEEDNVKVTILYLEQMGLLECINADEFFLTRVPELIGTETDKAEMMRKSRQKRKELLESSNNVTDVLPCVTKCYTEKEIEKEKREDINNNVQSNDSTIRITKKDIEELFEKVWKLYPSKKGKGQVSESKKKELFKIGEEELTRAIERYKAEYEKDKSWRKHQNGSTFFTSGYVDYLDSNYEPSANNQSSIAKASPNNRFNNFPQRNYTDDDYNALEQKLLERSKLRCT